MNEPSDTTPDPGRGTERTTCENCGATLEPLDWVTFEAAPEGQRADSSNEPDGATGYASSLHFCDDQCLDQWKDDREG